MKLIETIVLHFSVLKLSFSYCIFSIFINRKPTYSLFTNFCCFIPVSYKWGLIHPFLLTLFQNFAVLCHFLCWTSKKLKTLCSWGVIPRIFFDNVWKPFLNKIFEKLSSNSETCETKRISHFDVHASVNEI